MTPLEYWTPIMTHPQVEPHTLMGLASIEDFADFLSRDDVEEERWPGGGMVYVNKVDVTELHIAFLPDQWGRPVAGYLARSEQRKASQGVTIVAREQEGYWRSRPPRSHGWKVNGEFEETTHPKRLRQWILTPDAWYASAVGRKYNVDHR